MPVIENNDFSGLLNFRKRLKPQATQLMGYRSLLKRTYLVTGGAGFIGSHVVDMLANGGGQVVVLDDFSTGRRENLLPERENVIVCEGDIRKAETVEEAFAVRRPNAVIHLAAQAAISTAMQDPARDLDINAGGTLTVLQAAERWQVEQFVYASTSAVYGDRNSSGMGENTSLKPDNPYGVSKAAGELYARIAKLPTTILRFGNVYGPRQVPLGENQVIARMMRHLLKGDEFYIFGDGRQKRDYVFVEDVARAALLAAQRREGGGVYNIAGGESYSVNEAAAFLADICGVPGYPWDHDLSRPDSRKAIQLLVEHAKNELGWSPRIGLVMGLRETLEWWRNNDPGAYLP